MIGRPEAGEHGAFYDRYVALVPGDDALAALQAQGAETAALVRALDPSLVDAAPAPGKWTLGQAVQHVIDTERVFAGRALHVARGDRAPLPGFDQDAWAANAPPRPFADLAASFEIVRAATLDLFASLPAADLVRVGTASGSPLSARGAAWIIAGHERHHVAAIRELYLG